MTHLTPIRDPGSVGGVESAADPVPLALTIPGVEVTAVGLTGLDRLDADRFATLVAHLDATSTSINWWIGDAATEQLIRARSGDRSLAAVPVPADQLHTARCVRVALTFPPDRRRSELTWSHHLETMALGEADQDRLLEAAVVNGLSVQALRAVIRQEAEDRNPTLDPDLPIRPPRIPASAIRKAWAKHPHGGFVASFDDPDQLIPIDEHALARIRALGGMG